MTSDDTLADLPGPQVPATTRYHPKVGLALGGGVARGWAHIGVIRAMERHGLKPDIIAGTSIGALVGGAYLAGHLDTLEDWARSLTKRRLLGYLDFNLGGSGFFAGNRLSKLMERSFGHILIEDLDRTFIAVTAELATAHEIWLREGPLIEAIKASYALPGVFPPAFRDNRWLIDGALVNPVPVSVCRAFGARLVIAVGLQTDAFGKSNLEEGSRLQEDDNGNGPDNGNGDTSLLSLTETLKLKPRRMIMRQLFGTSRSAPGIGTVMLGALNIVMDRLGRSRMAGDPPDVLVAPRVGHISLLDFDRAAESIRLGEEAFEEQLPRLEEAMLILS